MARYTERLNSLLEDGTITQETYDELADLSVAKDAIKEFNNVKRERDEFEQKVQQYESLPKRREALGQFGIDYDKSPKYLRSIFDSLDAKKLDDREYVSQQLRDNEIEVQLSEEQASEDRPAAADIVDAALSAPLTGSKVGATTPKDFAGWDPGKQRQFIRTNPQAYEQLKQGKSVVV